MKTDTLLNPVIKPDSDISMADVNLAQEDGVDRRLLISQEEKSARLQKIITEGSPEILASEVKISLAALEAMKDPLDAIAGEIEGAKHWVAQIDTLLSQKVDTPTIIGVVGNTGAGKSSVC